MKFILLCLFMTTNLFAYTLNNNFGSSFKNHKVTVFVDENTNCAQAGMTVYELKSLIGPAIKFWNNVPTSNLVLKNGGFSTATNNINHGRLCAPTDDSCINSAPGNVIAPVEDIIIACNDLGTNYGSSSVLAVTVPNNFSGRKIAGAVIIINETAQTIFDDLSRSDKIGVLAHEIGHAIGLGHTEDKAALMYFRTVDQRSKLGKDDMRGVSYLYPMQIDAGGLLGGCGTITNADGSPPSNPPFWQMGAALILMIALFELLKLLNRPKTCSAA